MKLGNASFSNVNVISFVKNAINLREVIHHKLIVAKLPTFLTAVKSRNVRFIHLRKLCDNIKQVFMDKNIDMEKLRRLTTM